MKIFKTLVFYFLFIILVILFWIVIGLITVLMGETIGVRLEDSHIGSLILGGLGWLSVKQAWSMARKLAKKIKGGE